MTKLEALTRRRRAVIRLSVHESLTEVNRLGCDAQVVSRHRYLVVFHPFVEHLTVFHTSGLVLASCSIFQVLDLDLHAIILSSTCQKVRKLCINPYISIVNSLRTNIQTYIQAQPQTKAPLALAALAGL